MLNRLKIIAKWIFIYSCFYVAFLIFIHPMLAAVAAFVFSVSAFFHPSNEKEVSILKRPVIYIGK